MSDETEVGREARIASWWTAAVAFLGGIGGGVVFPILPTLGTRLGLSAATVGVILSANRVTRIFFNPVTGGLIDRYGGKWPVSVGLIIEATAIFGFVVALHSGTPALWFLGGRILWGIGSSLLMVGAMAAVLALSGLRDRGRMVARVRTAMSLGLPAGLLVGGVIADIISPEVAFFCAIALSLVAAGCALWGVPMGGHRGQEQAARGGAWLSRVWRSFVNEPSLVVVWSYNLLLFLTVQGVLLATLVLLVAHRGLYVPGLHEQGSAGVLMAMLMLFRAGAALTIGNWLYRGYARTQPLLLAVLLLAAGFAALSFATTLWQATLGLVATGIGTGALSVPLLSLLGDLTAEHERGWAIATYQVFGDVGGSIGPVLGLQVGAAVGFLPLYAGLGALIAASLPATIWLGRRERARDNGAGNAR